MRAKKKADAPLPYPSKDGKTFKVGDQVELQLAGSVRQAIVKNVEEFVGQRELVYVQMDAWPFGHWAKAEELKRV